MKIRLTVDKLLSSFFLLIGVFYVLSSRSLTLGTFSAPGEGFIPIIIGMLMIIFSSILLFRRETSVERSSAGRDVTARVIKIAGTILAYVFLIALIGFKLSTFLVLLVSVRIFGGDNWKGNIIFSLITTVFSVILFQVWLQLPLPEPILDLIFGS